MTSHDNSDTHPLCLSAFLAFWGRFTEALGVFITLRLAMRSNPRSPHEAARGPRQRNRPAKIVHEDAAVELTEALARNLVQACRSSSRTSISGPCRRSSRILPTLLLRKLASVVPRSTKIGAQTRAAKYDSRIPSMQSLKKTWLRATRAPEDGKRHSWEDCEPLHKTRSCCKLLAPSTLYHIYNKQLCTPSLCEIFTTSRKSPR